MTLCIGVWGNCSVFMFNEVENMHIKAGRIIHISDIINCETLGYVHKRGLAAEVCKIKFKN